MTKDLILENNTKHSNTIKNFILVWIGQLLSSLGSNVSSFGLSVVLYQVTESTTSFVLANLCCILPSILFAPFAGSFADRKNRKFIIIFTDCLDATLKITMCFLLIFDFLQVWMVYPIIFLSSSFGAFQEPAFSASIPLLVEKKNLTRATGLMQLSRGIQQILSPILAGALLPIVQLEGLLAIDFFTFFFAILTVSVIKIHQPETPPSTNQKGLKGIFEDFSSAFKYIKSKTADY